MQEGDILEGDMQEGDILEGDIQEGDIQEVDIQEGDIQEGDTQEIFPHDKLAFSLFSLVKKLFFPNANLNTFFLESHTLK